MGDYIITITNKGKPAFAAECEAFAGCAVLDGKTCNSFLLGNGTPIADAMAVAALQSLVDEVKRRRGRKFRRLVKEIRKHGKQRRDE